VIEVPSWANSTSAALGRGMAGISSTMWPKRKRRRYRRYEEWIWVVIILGIFFWAAVWLALEAVMIVLWLLVVIAGGLHALALFASRPLRRTPGTP
jgi:hypothetical protein